MNIITLIHTLRDAVADDPDTKTWCDLQYGRTCKVYVGMDHRNPPAETDYPVVHFFPISKSTGWDANQQEYSIGVTCGIYDDDERTIFKKDVVEFESVENIETFRKHVETAIEAAMPTGYRISLLNIEYEVMEFYPFLLVSQEFTVVAEQYGGSDPLD